MVNSKKGCYPRLLFYCFNAKLKGNGRHSTPAGSDEMPANRS